MTGTKNKFESKPKLAWYENNKDFTDPVKKYLNQTFNVNVYGDPMKAEKEIYLFNPDIIVFDYRMPYKSGLEMYRILKESGLTFIPVFYTIWAKDKSTKMKLMQAGIEEEAIIDKHMSCESFAEKIYQYFINKKSNEK